MADGIEVHIMFGLRGANVMYRVLRSSKALPDICLKHISARILEYLDLDPEDIPESGIYVTRMTTNEIKSMIEYAVNDLAEDEIYWPALEEVRFVDNGNDMVLKVSFLNAVILKGYSIARAQDVSQITARGVFFKDVNGLIERARKKARSMYASTYKRSPRR